MHDTPRVHNTLPLRPECQPLRFGVGVRWLGLDVKRHLQQDADHASVEFKARSKLGGKAARLHESSRFVRGNGRWFYVDGDIG